MRRLNGKKFFVLRNGESKRDKREGKLEYKWRKEKVERNKRLRRQFVKEEKFRKREERDSLGVVREEKLKKNEEMGN